MKKNRVSFFVLLLSMAASSHILLERDGQKISNEWTGQIIKQKVIEFTSNPDGDFDK